MVDLRQFRQFATVAELLSFRSAAERLNMAQPPLTVAIRKLEDEIGAPLLERTNRVVRLTDAGKVFLEEATKTLQQADWAVQASKRAAAGLTGRLRVSFVPHAARDLLPKILRAFRESHPDVELVLKESMTAQQVLALLNDEADVGFLIPPIRAKERMQRESLWRQSLVVALPEHHRFAECGTVPLGELADEAWVLFPSNNGQGLYENFRSACIACGFVPHIAQEALLMDTIVGLVSSGIGIGIVSRNFSSEKREGVVFRELVGVDGPIYYEICVAYARQAPVISGFLSVVRGGFSE